MTEWAKDAVECVSSVLRKADRKRVLDQMKPISSIIAPSSGKDVRNQVFQRGDGSSTVNYGGNQSRVEYDTFREMGREKER